MKATTRALSIAGAFALVVGALTGCSSVKPMTQEEACTYLQTEGTAYMKTMEEKLSDTSSMDPQKALKLQGEMLNKLDSIGNGVGHADVKTKYKAAVGAAKDLMTLSEKAMKDPSVMMGDQAQKALTHLTEASDEFQAVCSSGMGGLFG